MRLPKCQDNLSYCLLQFLWIIASFWTKNPISEVQNEEETHIQAKAIFLRSWGNSEPDAAPKRSRANLRPGAADGADVFQIRSQVKVSLLEPLPRMNVNSWKAQMFAFNLLIRGHQRH